MPEGQVDTGRVTHIPQMHRDVAWKQPVRAATTAAGTFASAFDAASVVDGVTLVEGDRLLVKDQADATENGIYAVPATGAPLRAYDMDGVREFAGAVVYVLEGTANAGAAFVCTAVGDVAMEEDDVEFADWPTIPPPAAVTVAISFLIDGAGATITTGVKGDLSIPFAATITGARLLADQTGSIVVDVWKDAYANYPPAVGDSITASAKPTISGATRSEDTTLTGWTTSIAAGDTLRFNVDSVTTIQRVTLTLRATRT